MNGNDRLDVLFINETLQRLADVMVNIERACGRHAKMPDGAQGVKKSLTDWIKCDIDTVNSLVGDALAVSGQLLSEVSEKRT